MIEMTAPVVERLTAPVIDRLRAIRGLTATVSDVLDQLGWNLTVPATVLAPRHPGPAAVVGYAITSGYLPARRRAAADGRDVDAGGGQPPPPAFDPGYRLGSPGDVLVLGANGLDGISVLGGRVAAAARRAGIAAAVVDGAVRDLDEMHDVGLAIWSRGVTPVTGKSRVEQVSVNIPVFCAGVQVHPGDLVVADASGVCFVPPAVAAEVADRVLRAAAAERAAEARGAAGA